MATNVVDKKPEAPITKIFRWCGIGPVHLPSGKVFHWPVRNPVLVTADTKIHAQLADAVDDRLLLEIDPNDQHLDESLLNEIREAIAQYEDGTTPLPTSMVGRFGTVVSGILNSDNIRATAQRSDTSAPAAPTATSSPVNLKASLDAIANAKL